MWSRISRRVETQQLLHLGVPFPLFCQVESQEGLKHDASMAGWILSWVAAQSFLSPWGVLDVYLYLGKVSLGPLSGYLWLLGRRLYIKTGWRPRDTYFLGNLGGSPLHSGKAEAPYAEACGREEGRGRPR